ncbi:MAG: hypothetical protein V4622_01660 [Bacteroidota bacterium]
MKKSITVSFYILLMTGISFTQPYVEGGNTRHRFAQLTLGLTNQFYSNANTKTYQSGLGNQFEERKLTNQFQSQFIIGGTHFWGHADFYVTIPIYASSKEGYRSIGETAFKYYPWRIENKKVRPFVGFMTLTSAYKQGNGVNQVRFKYPLVTGLTFNYKHHLIEFTTSYTHNNSTDYFVEMNNQFNIVTPKLMTSISYKYYLETTGSAEKNWESGYTKKLTDTLAKLHRLNGFTLGIAPSASFFLKKSSEHNKELIPYLGQHRMSKVYFEFAAGYYWHRPDLQMNLSYRTVKSNLSAFNYSQYTKREALTLEVYKFIADYHGFATFIGPALSYEELEVKDINQIGLEQKSTYYGLKPGLTFGWDIRPNRIQSWYLRTNLRWFPNLNVNMASGKKVSLDQLEINFIEFVFFPSKFF